MDKHCPSGKSPGDDVTGLEAKAPESLETGLLLKPVLAQDDQNGEHSEYPQADEMELLNSVLLKETKTLIQFTDVPTLLPILKCHQMVTGDDFLYLLKRWEDGFRNSTVGILLEVLQRKHPHWAFLLLESLREEGEHKGHAFLIDHLKEAVKQKKELQVEAFGSLAVASGMSHFSCTNKSCIALSS